MKRSTFVERKISGHEVSETGGMVHRATFLDEMVKLVPPEAKLEFNKKTVHLHQDNGGVVIQFADNTGKARRRDRR